MQLDVLWEPHSFFFCFDTAPDLLEICKDSYPNALIQPPKMHFGMCPSAVALSGFLPQCSFDFREILLCFYGFP